MNTETDATPLSPPDVTALLPEDEQLRGHAIQFMLSARSNLDWSKVDPKTHWDRLLSVFRGQAQMSRTFPEMVEGTRRALQIGAWDSKASNSVSLIGSVMTDPKRFRRFQRIVSDECSYLIAETRVFVDADKSARSQKHE